MSQREKTIAVVMGALILIWGAGKLMPQKAPVKEGAGPPAAKTATRVRTETKEALFDIEGVLQLIHFKETASCSSLERDPFVEVSRPKAEVAAESPSFQLQLFGIMLEGEKPLALINDEIVEEGDALGSFVVQEIRTNEVVLQQGMARKVLKLYVGEEN